MGFGVWGLGFGVWGLGFGVWGLGFGVWGLGFGVWGLGLCGFALLVRFGALGSGDLGVSRGLGVLRLWVVGLWKEGLERGWRGGGVVGLWGCGISRLEGF